MDKAEQERAKVSEPQKDGLGWNNYFKNRYEWLTKQIGALENFLLPGNEPEPKLGVSWTLGLYQILREHLDVFNETHTNIADLRTTIATLQKRVELLEVESSEQAKDRKIRGIEK
jgi:hypothetical protein